MRMKIFNLSDEFIDGAVGGPLLLPVLPDGSDAGIAFRLKPTDDKYPNLWGEIDAREVDEIYNFIANHCNSK